MRPPTVSVSMEGTAACFADVLITTVIYLTDFLVLIIYIVQFVHTNGSPFSGLEPF